MIAPLGTALVAPALLAVELFDGHAIISDSTGRAVRIPARVFTRCFDSQAGKDRRRSVAERVCVAAHRHPRLMGATPEAE